MTIKRHYACVCCVFVVVKLNIIAQQAGMSCHPINGHPMPYYGKYSKTSVLITRDKGARARVWVVVTFFSRFWALINRIWLSTSLLIYGQLNIVQEVMVVVMVFPVVPIHA